jgi:Ca2+-binding EF-hand superfamily protein
MEPSLAVSSSSLLIPPAYGVVELPALFPDKISDTKQQVNYTETVSPLRTANTDFFIPKHTKNIHYGSPSVLSKYYHQPGSYHGQETGYSSEDASDSEEMRLRKKKHRRRCRKKKKKRKRKTQKKRERDVIPMKNKLTSSMLLEKDVIQSDKERLLIDFFARSYQYPTHHTSFSVTLSPIRSVAIRDKIRKSKVQVFPTTKALTNFVSKEFHVKPQEQRHKGGTTQHRATFSKSAILNFEIGTKMSKRSSTTKYLHETAAIVIQRVFRRYKFLRRTHAAIVIEDRIREHNWCKEIIRKNIKKMENRFILKIFSTWQVYSTKRLHAKKMALRKLHGFQAKCFDMWNQWTCAEIQERLRKQEAVIKKIVHGKIIRALKAWSVYTQNNKKVNTFRKVWNRRISRHFMMEWQHAAYISHAANRIRKFWKAKMVSILMHKSWLVRTDASIEIERICRGYLAKKHVAALRKEYCATRIQSWYRGTRGRKLADQEFNAEILREQIRYLHEQHLVSQFMTEAKLVTRKYPTHAMITKFGKYLWNQNRKIEYDADRALKRLHVLIDSESEDDDNSDDDEDDNGKDEERFLKKARDHKAISLDEVTNHAFAIFDLFDVNRTSEISETDLLSMLKEMGLRNPEYEATTVDRILSKENERKAKNAKRIQELNCRLQNRRSASLNSNNEKNDGKVTRKQLGKGIVGDVLNKKKSSKNKIKVTNNTKEKPKVALVGFLNYYMGQYNTWQIDNSRFIPKIRHMLNYHRYASAKRALVSAIDVALENAAINIFRDSKPPHFCDTISGLPFATLQQFNTFNAREEHLKKNGIRGPWNKIPADSKSGMALKWLNMPSGGELHFQNLVKDVMKQEKALNLHGQLKTHVIAYKNLEEGEIILEYYPRKKNAKGFEIKLPPMYESFDMNREIFFERSNILDPNISRDGHVRFTHGLHNTIQVRSIGKYINVFIYCSAPNVITNKPTFFIFFLFCFKLHKNIQAQMQLSLPIPIITVESEAE